MEADQSELEIIYALGSNTGRVRDHNEDYVTVKDPGQPARRLQGMLFVVADGMGGYQAGEVASESAAKVTISEYYAGDVEDVSARLRSAIQAANTDIYQKAQNNAAHSGMGTTIVAAAVLGRQVHIASVGDSRAYLVRKNAITQITVDHSLVGEQVEAGILTKEQAKAHPQRNVITRAVGSAPTVQVDTFQGELQADDIIILCSDGLTEHVAEDGILSTVTRYNPDQAVSCLIELAREGGGTDNISVVVLRARAKQDSGHVAALPAAGTSGTRVVGSLPTQLPPLPPQAASKHGNPTALWIAGGLLAAVVLIGTLASATWVISNLSKRTTTPGSSGEIMMSTTPAADVIEATATLTAMPTATIAPTFTPEPFVVVPPTSTITSTIEVSVTPPVSCPGGQTWNGTECACPPDQPDWLDGHCVPKGPGGGSDSTSESTQEPTPPPR